MTTTNIPPQSDPLRSDALNKIVRATYTLDIVRGQKDMAPPAIRKKVATIGYTDIEFDCEWDTVDKLMATKWLTHAAAICILMDASKDVSDMEALFRIWVSIGCDPTCMEITHILASPPGINKIDRFISETFWQVHTHSWSDIVRLMDTM